VPQSSPALAAVPSPDPVGLVPIGLNFDDLDTPADVVDALILSAFADGSQPCAKTVRIAQIKPEASLLPAGAQSLRVAVDSGREARLATGDGWTVRAVVWRGGAAEVTVTAQTQDVVESMLTALVADAEAARAESDGRVSIGFWHRSDRRGATRSVRKVAAQPWTEIRRNYAGATASALDRLMAVQPPGLSGQLLLLYGPPGTGKTTALRALAREWLPWCDTDCVVDPDTLFNDPSYLMEVTLGDDDDGEADGRWRLLLLEDCDELIGGDAKRSSGQALSRLLNLTDGLLGQGRHVLVAITTNEDLRSLHPAAIRPGRCLAQVEVGPFPSAEAAAWLGRPDDGSGAMTLADLYARQNAQEPISSAQPPAKIGLYL
jgi:Domain of unknown function (DUF5925)/ATPase family associated with various cellular activities (AAA)